MTIIDSDGEYHESEFSDGCFPICLSNTGKLIAPYSLLRKAQGKTPSKNQIRGITPEASSKGFDNEKLFRSMFVALVARGALPKNFRVRRSSRNEDEKFKIDCWIDILQEDGSRLSIPIQLKSSIRGKNEFIQKFGERIRHIYIIVMDEDMTALHLMRRIFLIVARYHREHDLPPPPKVKAATQPDASLPGLVLS